jgi:ubiquitin C
MPQLFIRTITGRCFPVDCPDDVTISHLKKLIQVKTGFSVEAQLLLFRGMLLEDDLFFMDYDLQSESKIHLVMRYRGG